MTREQEQSRKDLLDAANLIASEIELSVNRLIVTVNNVATELQRAVDEQKRRNDLDQARLVDAFRHVPMSNPFNKGLS